MAGSRTDKGVFHVVRAVLVLVAVGILCCSAGGAQEIQVVLRNGDRLTGTLVTEDALRVTLTNGLLGRFVVPTALIERRVLVGTPAVPKPPAKPTGALTGGPPSPAATDTTIVKRIAELEDSYRSNKITSLEYHRERSKLVARMDTTNGMPSRVPSANTTPAVQARPSVKFNGEIQAGLDLAFATKDRQLYTSRMKLVHTQSLLRNTADFSFTYGRVEGEVSANRMEGMLKTDYDLTRRLYLYNLGGGGYDVIRKLDNYFQIGPGVGDRIVKMTNYVLNLEGGANFQRQLRSDGTETDIFYFRLAQESKLSVSQKLTFDERFEYFPQWNNFGEYRLRFEANLKYFLRGNLFLNLTMIDLYDTMPGKGVDSNDLQIRSAIGMKF